MRPRAVGQIEWTVEAGLREGLIPFDHKRVMTRHGRRIRLAVPHTGMLTIPFGCPDILRYLHIVQLLNARRSQWSTHKAAAVPIDALGGAASIDRGTGASIAIDCYLATIATSTLQQRAIRIIVPRLAHRIQGIIVLAVRAHALAAAAARSLTQLSALWNDKQM